MTRAEPKGYTSAATEQVQVRLYRPDWRRLARIQAEDRAKTGGTPSFPQILARALDALERERGHAGRLTVPFTGENQ
jgi:hypothetical protein